jgi:allantoin racemase
MKNRIAVIGTGFRPVGETRPPEEIARIVSEGFDTRLVEIPDGIFPGDHEARAIVDTQYLAAGHRAADAGFDAVYINTVGDYGLAEMRAELDIAVIGSGETAYRTAATLGRFAIVTIWPPALDFIRERVLAQSGVAESHIGVTNLSQDDELNTLADDENFVTDMRSCSLVSLNSIRKARDAAIEEQGADVVILGCTCMAPAAAMLPPNGNGVTIDPMTLGYRFAEYCLASDVAPQDADYKNASAWLN